MPTVYVESFTRIDELSLTARLISPIASRLYVQWPELAKHDPRACASPATSSSSR